ncbi:MAG: hypothetical protein E7006_01195 [Alphaproteobacteria bacterium]|nr:hypothetical protein [Alphaproteobacteria bacterium]
MTDKTKTNKKIKGGPDLTLSANDKMYLAIAFNQSELLAFIHTLFCRGRELDGVYNARAESEMLTFKKSSDAKVYYATLQQIQQAQTHSKIYDGMAEFNKELIAQFHAAHKQK